MAWNHSPGAVCGTPAALTTPVGTVGKLGAIISTIWIIAIYNQKHVFLVSAMWAIGGMAVTWLMLPVTTGLDLKELDDMHRAFMAGTPELYTGEAINPKHLSPFEMFFFGWHKNYKRDPKLVYKNPCASEAEEPCCREVQYAAARVTSLPPPLRLKPPHLTSPPSTLTPPLTSLSVSLSPPRPIQHHTPPHPTPGLRLRRLPELRL